MDKRFRFSSHFLPTYSHSEIETAVELALDNKISNTAGIKHILLYTKDTAEKIKPLSNWQISTAPDTSIYAQLRKYQMNKIMKQIL